jgi:hypothetical protein
VFELPTFGRGFPDNGATGDHSPAGKACGREHSHIEQAVVYAGARQESEAPRQSANIADHNSPGLADERFGPVQSDLHPEVGPSQVRKSAYCVAKPSQLFLQQPRRAVDDSRIDADPGHGYEGRPVRHGQVHQTLAAAKTSLQCLSQFDGDTERLGKQVRRASRHDCQRYARAGEVMSAGSHGAVPTDSKN